MHDLPNKSQPSRRVDGLKSNLKPVPLNVEYELQLIDGCCSGAGQSAFPPTKLVQRLLRQIGSLDHPHICRLLEKKLEDALWYVVGRALVVLDSLLLTEASSHYLTHFATKKSLFQYLMKHPKQIVKCRSEKVYSMLANYEPVHQVPLPRGVHESKDSRAQESFMSITSPSITPEDQFSKVITALENNNELELLSYCSPYVSAAPELSTLPTVKNVDTSFIPVPSPNSISKVDQPTRLSSNSYCGQGMQWSGISPSPYLSTALPNETNQMVIVRY